MLLRYTVENFLSFRDETVFSMVASADERHPNHVIRGPTPTRPAALRGAAIYGANGHGKTNFVESLDYLQTYVVEGTASIMNRPFLLSRATSEAPSRFSVEFRVGPTDYEYGLVISNNLVKEEWLFSRHKRVQVPLFQRTVNEEGESTVEFGAALVKSKSPSKNVKTAEYLRFLSIGLKQDIPFLREANEKRIEYLKAPFNWFSNTLRIVSAESYYGDLHGRAKEEKGFLDSVSAFVRDADVGLHDINVEEIVIVSNEELPEPVSEAALKRLRELKEGQALAIRTPEGPGMILKRNEDGTVAFLKLVSRHLTEEGEIVSFDILAESAGTRRLMDLVPLISDATAEDVVYVVDELDRKLHPLLAYRFVESYLNCPRGQLIFTTHNTYLLDLNLLRRDEVWFVQKDKRGHSDMYSLLDFKIRPDLDVRRGYLNGRFGAIPFLGNVADLGWCSSETQ